MIILYNNILYKKTSNINITKNKFLIKYTSK